MKIVIDVPETVFREFIAGTQSMKNDVIISNAVFDGTPLPKNHGRLIDADALKEIIGQFPLAWEYGQGVNDCWDALVAAPTIIAADKEDDT